MKLVLQVQLLPDADATTKLAATVARFNEACNWVAGVAFEQKCANKIDLQRIAYREIRERFTLPKGETDLMLRKDGRWFLAITVDVPEAAPIEPKGIIGVDLGVKNLATTDDGETFSGDDVETCRKRYGQQRKTCQRTGTKSAKRKLHKIRKKESRFRKDRNQCIAKRIVAKAKGTDSAIACEDLAGIGERTTVGKAQRSRMKGWAFLQLRRFITYKAALAGIPIIMVDPRNTSRTCSECGDCCKANRKSRDEFECRHCGFALPADWNAARNIRDRGKVMCPIVGVVDAGIRTLEETTGKPVLASPRLQPGVHDPGQSLGR